VGRRNLEVSRWLPEADGSQHFAKKLHTVAGEQHNWRKWGEEDLAINGFGKGPMDMVLEEENDAVALVEGKKRQRVVEKPVDFLGSKEGSSGKSGGEVTKLSPFDLKLSGAWIVLLREGFEDGGRIHPVVSRTSWRELASKCKSGLINNDTNT
ncbi:hypothetical protein Gogos_020834, partial [Gossypium gossypioides]|nr:hypothetical protein [Gossypium gossypioides]